MLSRLSPSCVGGILEGRDHIDPFSAKLAPAGRRRTLCARGEDDVASSAPCVPHSDGSAVVVAEHLW